MVRHLRRFSNWCYQLKRLICRWPWSVYSIGWGALQAVSIWILFLVTTIGNRWDPSSEGMTPSSESFMLALATISLRSRTVLWLVIPVAIYKQALELRTEIESSRYYTCEISRTRFKSNSDHVDISLEETFLIFKMPNRRIGRLEIKCIQYTLEYTLLLIGATHSVPLSWQNTNSVSTPTQMMSY